VHVDVNGTRLWFDVDGASLVAAGAEMHERPTVVLLHGGPGSFDHTYLKPDFARLTEVAQVVYLDLPGHGRSGRGDAAAWSFEGAADDVRAFCDVLGIERPVVYGHSFGGFVAMLYAARHPSRVGALVLQSTSARVDVDRIVEGFRRFGGDEVAAIARRAYGGVGEPVTGEEWRRCWQVLGPRVPGDDVRARTVVNRELNAVGFDLMRAFDAVDELAHVECPTLVCVGELDPITPVDASREIVEALVAAPVRLEVLEGLGHFPWLDVPERYWPPLLEFVATAGDVPRATAPA
jgi:pimeloyl-ACP methyl ester carboxylesterase